MSRTKATKKSLQEMLAERTGKRNDWNNGPPAGAATRIGPDGFPEYDPSAFESDHDEDGDDGYVGGAFAALAGLGGELNSDEEFVEVVSKKNKKKLVPPTGPSGAGAGPSGSRPPAAPAARGPSAGAGPSSSRAAALPVPRPSAALVMPRAPYGLGAAEAAPPPRAPRARTHDDEGRPLTDTYYQTFQKVYRNAGGDVCMRFHKTDIVIAKPSGEVVVTSGGYKTKTTFQSVSEGLEPMGIILRSSRGEGYGEWWVELPDGSRQDWLDNMTIPAASAEDRGRGQRLLAAYHGTSTAAAPATSTSGRAAAGPVGAPYRPGAAAAPPPAAYRQVGYAPTSSATGAAASAAGPYAAGRTGAAGPGAAGGYGAQSAAATRDPSVAAAAGSGGGDAEALHALISSALLLQDEALIAGNNQVQAEHLLDDEHCCIACMAALKTTVLIPCGHMVLCAECAADVMTRTGVCPMCRQQVETTVTVQ